MLVDLVCKSSFGPQFESYLYRTAEHFSADYAGGMWISKKIEGEPKDMFYLELIKDSSFETRNTLNFYDSGDMDSLTFSLSIFAFTLSTFASAFMVKIKKMRRIYILSYINVFQEMLLHFLEKKDMPNFIGF